MTEVARIKAELGAGTPHNELARQYGVSRSAISLIAAGSTWRDIAALSETP